MRLSRDGLGRLGVVRAGGHRPADRRHDRRAARRPQPPRPAPHPRHPGRRRPRPGTGRWVVIHLAVGQGFALGYAATFALLGIATWWLGALLGLLHVAVALTVLVPLLVGI